MEETTVDIGYSQNKQRCPGSLQRISCGLIAILSIVVTYLSLMISRFCLTPETFQETLIAQAFSLQKYYNATTGPVTGAAHDCPKCEKCPTCTVCPTCPTCPKCKPCKAETPTTKHHIQSADPSKCPRGFRNCATCHNDECLTCIAGYSLPAKGCFSECNSNCRICDPYDPNHCIECVDSVNREPPLCFDTTICPDTIPNCATCNPDGSCMACKPGYTGSKGGCFEQCDPRCAECSDEDGKKCTVCEDPVSGDPPYCYPEGVCDPDNSKLANCMECVKRQCLKCKDGYAMPSTQCKTRCGSNCVTCDQTDPSLCTECRSLDSRLPECLPYGECNTKNPTLVKCAMCDGQQCLVCKDGWSNARENCTVPCASDCATCSDENASFCRTCKDSDRQPPLCLPRGVCNAENSALKTCDSCDGDTCISCQPGFSVPEENCTVRCSPLCAECELNNATMCLKCSDVSRHPPTCLPYGECDAHDPVLKNCKSCDGSRCLTCNEGFGNLDGNCRTPCSGACKTCDPSDVTKCTQCILDTAAPPLCLAPGQCSAETKYAHCKTCENERCTECQEGYTGPFCGSQCHSYCQKCVSNDANYCTRCSSSDTEPPYCYPAGTCNPELMAFCSSCTGNKCTACREGMTNIANNCNDVCSDWCRTCSATNANECTACRYRGMEPPHCNPPSAWSVLWKALKRALYYDSERALIYSMALLMVPLLAGYLSAYLCLRRNSLQEQQE